MSPCLTNRWLTNKNCSPRVRRAKAASDKPLHPYHICALFDGHQALIVLAPEHANDALAQGGRPQIKQLAVVGGKRKMNGLVRQCDAVKFIDDVPHFNGVGFAGIPAGGNVEEQVAHGNLRALMATGVSWAKAPPSMFSWMPHSSLAWRVFNSTWAMEAIEANASPRNLLDTMVNRSSADVILEVAWRSQRFASASTIPTPLSITWISVRPASTTRTSMREAPASAFHQLLTAEAGR